MADKYAKDNYYTRFDICSYHCFREMTTSLDYESHWSVSCRSRSPGHTEMVGTSTRFDLIMSHQQPFSYKGTGLPGLNQY